MWHTMQVGEIIKKLRTDLNTGLTEKSIEKIRNIYGENKLIEEKKKSIIVKLLKQFNDFMIIVLIIASVISGVIEYTQGTNDYLDSIIIIFIVILNAIIGVIQEEKAEKSLDALKKMSAPITKVKRDGIIKSIPSTQIVPGDYIIIETGSYIPADSRLIKSNNLKIDESCLTGETIPVLKNEKVILKNNAQLRRYDKYGIWGNNCSIWTWRSNCL